MPKEYIYEPWTAPPSIQAKAKCIIGKDYPKPGQLSWWSLLNASYTLYLGSTAVHFKTNYSWIMNYVTVICSLIKLISKEIVVSSCMFCRDFCKKGKRNKIKSWSLTVITPFGSFRDIDAILIWFEIPAIWMPLMLKQVCSWELGMEIFLFV